MIILLKYLPILILTCLLAGCNKFVVSNNVNAVTNPISPLSLEEDTQSIIPLSYIKTDKSFANHCSVSSLSNITVTKPCVCVAGDCSVGVKGTQNYYGPASFSYTVSIKGKVSNLSTANLTINSVDDAPVASNITPAAFDEDTASIITLAYSDIEGDPATLCSVSSLSNITISQACSCSSGVCTVGITGVSNYFGAASFNYTVTALGLVSNSASATFSINPVDDAPVASNITPAAFDEDIQSIITLVYSDIENDQATTCSLSTLSNVFISQACACSSGVCTVGITGVSNYFGAASFNYTVTALGLVSNSASATFSINPVDDAPVASNITPPSFNRNNQSIISLQYADAENDPATLCSVSSLSNITISQACSCAAGICTVGVTGTINYFGAASFSFNVTANGQISNTANASLSILKSWTQEAYIKAANADINDEFGISASISGDTLVVGAFFESSNQNTITNGSSASADNSLIAPGAAYVYIRSGTSWTQQAYLKAPNCDQGDTFGRSLSINKDTIVVGAINEDSNETTITNGTTASANNGKSNSGAAYVFKRTGSTWAQEAYIKSVNADVSDEFGASTSVHRDTVVIGSIKESSNLTTITNGATASADNTRPVSGAVYVYKRSGSTWTQEAYIKAANADIGDAFGLSVSINRDSIAVGSINEDSNQTTITNGNTASTNNTTTDAGAVYIYKRAGTTWTQEAYIKAANADASDQFGFSVSISEDTLVVGSINEDSNQTTITNGTSASADNSKSNSGAAYVFRRTGTTWVQEAYLKASNGGVNDSFGLSSSISGDTIIVGAYLHASGAGASYVFNRVGSSWVQEAYLTAANSDPNDQFGFSTSISGDTLVTTSRWEDSNQITITNGITASTDNSKSNSGAVYIYRNTDRLFEVIDLTAIATSNSVTLSWTKSGGAATGYFIAYALGSTPPANCNSGTNINVGNVATFTESLLSSSTTYSFRVCSTQLETTFSEGLTRTITTLL